VLDTPRMDTVPIAGPRAGGIRCGRCAVRRAVGSASDDDRTSDGSEHDEHEQHPSHG